MYHIKLRNNPVGRLHLTSPGLHLSLLILIGGLILRNQRGDHLDLFALQSPGGLQFSIFHDLARPECPESIALDITEMDKDIQPFFVYHKPKTFSIIKPLDSTFWHTTSLRIAQSDRFVTKLYLCRETRVSQLLFRVLLRPLKST